MIHQGSWSAGAVIYHSMSGSYEEHIAILTERVDGLWRGHCIVRGNDGVWKVGFDNYISSVNNPSASPRQATSEQATLLRTMLLSHPLYGRQQIRPF